MPEMEPPKDLEERTFEFARDVRDFVKQLPTTETNIEDVPQLVRASGIGLCGCKLHRGK